MFGIQQIWTAKGDSLLGGMSSLDDSTTRNLGQLLLVLQKRSLSESMSESWSFVFVWGCHVMFINDSLRFVPTRRRVQQGDAHKRKLQQARTRAQNVIYSGDKGTKSLLLSPDWP